MKATGIVTVTILLFVFVQSSFGQVYQLENVRRFEEADKIQKLSADQLLELQEGKQFVISFLGSSSDQQFRLTSPKYKRLHKTPPLKSIFDKESYLRIEFQEVTLFDDAKPQSMTVKANVDWAAEGFEGVQTFYFLLVKEQNEWVLDWLIH